MHCIPDRLYLIKFYTSDYIHIDFISPLDSVVKKKASIHKKNICPFKHPFPTHTYTHVFTAANMSLSISKNTSNFS